VSDWRDTALKAVGLYTWNDESPDKPGSFAWKSGKLYPKAGEYRVVRYLDDRLGLQANVGQWVDVLFYDDGHDGNGKLQEARWVRLADTCRWSESGLKRLKMQLEGQDLREVAEVL
jgi:hypothetical protein